MSSPPYPRDLVGYGRTPPHPQWPGQARIAVQFVLNYLDLATQQGLQPVFETARMYRGPSPSLALELIFGITTFELG